MNKGQIKSILLVIVFLFPPWLLADRIYLRNGKTLEGTIVSQNRHRIRLRTGRRIRNVSKRSIRGIRYGRVKKVKKTRKTRKTPSKPIKKVVKPRKKTIVKPAVVVPVKKSKPPVKSIPKKVVKKKKEPLVKKKPAPPRIDKTLAEKKRRARAAEYKREQVRKENERLRKFEEQARERREKRRRAREQARRREAILIKKRDPKSTPKKIPPQPAPKKIPEKVITKKKAAPRTNIPGKPPAVKKAARKKTKPHSSNRMGNFLRSAVLPGWGQMGQGRTAAGMIYGGLFAGGLVALYELNRIQGNTGRDLDALNNPFANSTLTLLYLNGTSGLSNPLPSLLSNPVSAYLYQQPYQAQENRLNAQYAKIQGVMLGLAALYIWNLADVIIFEKQTAKGIRVQKLRGRLAGGIYLEKKQGKLKPVIRLGLKISIW